MALLENIQYLCGEQGTSVPKLEQSLGFGKGAIYKWEKSSPTADKLQKVANYFRVSLDYLLGRGDIYDVGRAIKEEREDQRLTEKDLADEIGVSEFELSQYEEDIVPLTEEIVNKIAKAFDMSFPALLVKHNLYDGDIHPHFDGDVDAHIAFKKAEEQDAQSEVPDIQTIAAHHDGDDWDDEELAIIEQFKKFVREKRNK